MCRIQKHVFLSFREKEEAGCQKQVFLNQGVTWVLNMYFIQVLFFSDKRS